MTDHETCNVCQITRESRYIESMTREVTKLNRPVYGAFYIVIDHCIDGDCTQHAERIANQYCEGEPGETDSHEPNQQHP